MTRLKQSTLLGICIMLGIGVRAQTDSVYRFSLSEAQSFAIENYFASKNAALDIEAARKKVWETTAMGLPQLSATVDYTYMPVLPEVSLGSTFAANKQAGDIIYAEDFWDEDFYGEGEPFKMGVESNLNYGITLSQLIFSGEYIVGLQAAATYKTLSQENYEKIKIDLRENIGSTYYAILILQKNREVLSETLENLKLNLEHTQKFYEQGLVEDTDVDQLSLVVKRTENNKLAVDNQIEYMQRLFKYQLGLDINQQVTLKDSLDDLIEQNIVLENRYNFNLDEHIDFKLLNTQVDLQSLAVSQQKSAYLPTLSGFYQYSGQLNAPDFNTNIPHILGVSMSIPILSSGMRIAKVGQAKIELDKAENMRDQEGQRLQLEASQAYLDYQTSLQNYYNEKENFELSERVFDKTTVRFKQGMVSALDLSTINNQYLQAQLSYATAVQDLLMTKIKLDKAFNKL